MRINVFVILISLLSIFISKGAEKKYPVSEIPKELLKNSKVVVRNNIDYFKINSISQAEMEVTEVYTIMNNAGLSYSYFIKGYSKFIKISDIKGVFYDKDGEVIKKLKKSELLDIPAISGFSLYEDNRAIVYKPDIESYPFTVEYTYKLTFNGLLSYPSWEVYDDYNVAVQNSEFVITAPSDFEIRQYYQNLDIKPEIVKGQEKTTYTWEAVNKTAIEDEPFSPSFDNFSPSLHIAPLKFEIANYEGKMGTWKDFGNWISELNKDRNNIPEESKAKIKALVADAKTDEEKVGILYKFMQDKTRYVNIAVGIGGWQPFESEVVDRLSYGDCKALSFYMKSILEIAGVNSYYTIVNAGAYADHILQDFPMNQFNHAMLCVPMQQDTMWLECTSQILPTGFIGDFTDDRNVLIIDGENSKLVRTKKYSINENVQKRNVTFNLSETGEGTAIVKTQYHGLAADNLIYRIDSPVEDTKKKLYNELEIKDFMINNFNYSLEKSRIPDLYENLELKIKNYAVAMGDRLVVPVNLMNRIDNIPKKLDNRSTDVTIRRSSSQIDTIKYVLPENFIIDNVPEKATIKSKFGEYTAECIVSDGGIVYIRKFDIYKGNYKPEDYESFRDFLKEISKADKSKLVLKKS